MDEGLSGKGFIELKGVKTHNLKNIDVSFPLGKLSVVTGLSGSGKSSLVFDTLYGESYRRYLESLSGYARQFMQRLPKPDLEDVDNLPPAVAVRQSRKGTSHRSTVGSLTEVNDLIKSLFANLSVVVCPGCDQMVTPLTGRQIVDRVAENFAGQKILVLTPVSRWKSLDAALLKNQLLMQGFQRFMTEAGDLKETGDVTGEEFLKGDLLIDRFQVSDSNRDRLDDSCRLGLQAGRGILRVHSQEGETQTYARDFCCFDCDLEFRKPAPAMFTFNHPLGACKTCNGYGREAVLDWSRIIPDSGQSLNTRGVKALNFGSHAAIWYRDLISEGQSMGISGAKKFSEYSPAEMHWLREGKDGKGGVRAFFTWLDSKKYKASYRIHRARYTAYEECRTCKGNRFGKESLNYRLFGMNPAEVSGLSIDDMSGWMREQEAYFLSKESCGNDAFEVCAEIRTELLQRLDFLRKTGLGYLGLDRSSATLSGGELQRIHLARCLGNSLTQALFCLDEPTTGLHAVDRQKLLELMKELCRRGNTVVVVEHDHLVTGGADYCIHLGPGAGEQGGFICPEPGGSGSWQVLSPDKWDTPEQKGCINLKKMALHNLKEVTCSIPLGAVTGVCGLSGSGKSSLITHGLYPLLHRKLAGSGPLPEGLRESQLELSGAGQGALAAVYLVDQAPLTRSSRSTLMTYLGVYDEVRKLLASQELAKHLGLSKGAFSFNVAGGRCEECRGLGTVIEDLSFLGEMDVTCYACQGLRFSSEVLSVRYRGKNLTDILKMTAAQARRFFHDRKHIPEVLGEVCRLGLGYLTLGQSTSTLSGGEAQRLRLAGILKEVSGSGPLCLIFDEPSSGLSDPDVYNLIKYFKGLVSSGHTLVVVEHHLDILRHSDYLIELGPGAGSEGGSLVFQGASAEITHCHQSVTAPFLR